MWININRNGRLGNRMFSRAHVCAAALELGEQVVDYGLLDVARYFPNLQYVNGMPVYGVLGNEPAQLPFWANKRLLGGIRNFRYRKTGQYGPFWNSYWEKGGDPDRMRLDTSDFGAFNQSRNMIFLDGYKLRCPDWVRKHAPEIRRLFSPHQHLIAKWQGLVDTYHQRYDVIVGVHMRSTDFQNAQGGRYYLTPAQYADIIRNRIDWHGQSVFCFLFSDDKYDDNQAFADLEEAWEGLPHLFFHGSEIDDITALSFCDRVLCPVTSTYSRWSVFMGGTPWIGVSKAIYAEERPLSFSDWVVPWDI